MGISIWGDLSRKWEIRCGFALFAFAVAMPPAQPNTTTSRKGGKLDAQQTISTGDHEGHAFALAFAS